MKSISKEERILRVVARGEHSGHAHILVGEDLVIEKDSDGNDVMVVPEGADVMLRHLFEEAWVERGEQVSIWDKEQGRDGHKDIKVAAGKYGVVHQIETDPISNAIRQVMD